MLGIARRLTLGDDGIWYAASAQAVSYPADGNDLCAAIENRSFWFRHRNACILAAVRAFPPSGTFFDVGGGNGHVALALSHAGYDVALIEPGLAGARNARRRGIETVMCATLDTAGVLPNSLGAVGLFDVIEHIEGDVTFLRRVHEAMQPGGRLYLTVPAYRALWSADDVHAGHFQRYSLAGICEVLDRAGFTVEFASYFFRVLPLPIALMRAAPYRLRVRRAPASAEQLQRDHGTHESLATRLLARLMRNEPNRIGRRSQMRFGSSCLVVARKPKS